MTVWSAVAELEQRAEPFVIATMVSARGSAPQEIGAKAAITAKGLFAGTVGGGKIEAHVIKVATLILQDLETKSQAPRLETWNLQRDIGMTCGGETTFLFECFPQSLWRIALFGAGHVAQALARTLQPLNCRLTVIDDREEWLGKLPEHPRIIKIHARDLPQIVPTLGVKTFFVVMTKGHATDLPILEKIFATYPDAPYVGVMGSDVKGGKIRNELVHRGIPANTIERLRCPIGLAIGGNEPEEIAISVTAQLLEFRGPRP